MSGLFSQENCQNSLWIDKLFGAYRPYYLWLLTAIMDDNECNVMIVKTRRVKNNSFALDGARMISVYRWERLFHIETKIYSILGAFCLRQKAQRAALRAAGQATSGKGEKRKLRAARVGYHRTATKLPMAPVKWLLIFVKTVEGRFSVPPLLFCARRGAFVAARIRASAVRFSSERHGRGHRTGTTICISFLFSYFV